MKIFICGQRSFGKAVLKRLYEDGHEIMGVAPPPQKRLKDKMVGYAQLNGIPIIGDCEKLVSDKIPDGTELVISAHSHWIVSDRILDKCKYGGIGFHPSLLPRHRGQDAVRWAVHMKDAVTGATIYNLRSNTCDGGDILMQKVVFIDPKEDYHRLWAKIFPIGVGLVSDAVKVIEKGMDCWEKQDERFATWEPSWERPRLRRNELIRIGPAGPDGRSAVPTECSGCERDCRWCTWNIADPSVYYRRARDT